MSNSKHQAIVYFNNGGKLFKSSLFDEALEQYQKAFETDPTLYDVHFSIAKTLLCLNKTQDGIAHFKKYAKLIPKGKQGRYAIGLSDTLVEQEKHHQALELVESLEVVYSEEQTFKLLPLLLANHRVDEAVHRMINLNEPKKTIASYKELLDNQKLPEGMVEKLQKEDIVPRFFTTLNKLKTLKTASFSNKEYNDLLNITSNQIEKTQKHKNSRYTLELDKADVEISKAQELLASEIRRLTKKKKTVAASSLLKILEKSSFDKVEMRSLKQSISKVNNDLRKRLTYKTLIISGIIAAVLIGSFFGYSSYKKSSAHDAALSTGTIQAYSQFLSEYGDDDEIHILREKKLHEQAVQSNHGDDINNLIDLYPNSKYLVSIKVNSPDANEILYARGIGDEYSNIKSDGRNTFRAPIGSKVTYRLSAEDKVTAEKTITIFRDLAITEELKSSKTLIFKDDFENNKYSWPVFNNSKKVYGRIKNSGAKITNGGLNLYHNYNDNNFVLSTIYLSKLKRSENFEITVDIQRNGYDKGTFILFGATKRAFNYLALNKNGRALFGYNNWDKSSEKWIKQSNGWESHSEINRGNNAYNRISIVKRGKNLTYSVNNSFMSQVPLKKWYGRRFGFGINDNTNSSIRNLEISILNRPPKTIFESDHVYFCWVQELNVRDDGSTKGEILTTISEGDPVKFLGEIGKKEVNATFREIYSPDYYYKVELLDGTIGWVHGGAIRGLKTQKPLKFNELKNLLNPK